MNKLLVCAFLLAAANCRATISFAVDPSSQSALLGSPVTLTLDVSGLGNGTALGSYDFVVGFDPTVLAYDNATFGTNLDPDSFGPIQIVTPNSASVEFYEVSPDPSADLLSLQPPAFTLVTIVFDTVETAVNSPVTLSEVAIGNQDGNDISGESMLNNAAVTVTQSPSVPEPAGIFLMTSGMLLLLALRKNFRPANSSDSNRFSEASARSAGHRG
jgi:hypothetical protein